MSEALINLVLLLMLAATTLGIIRVRNLFAVVVLTGIFSFLMASLLIVLDAVDVAMTEASVGAGISTVLVLGALHLTGGHEMRPVHTRVLPLVVAVLTGGALLWGAEAMPVFGDPGATIHVLGPDYLARTMPETGIPNAVTSTLASYRGFDTLGETTVIFTAGIAVLLLLKRPRRGGDQTRG